MTENQLLAEARELPDLDEFAGMSIRDIAQAIVHWPEDSEDQARAIAAIRTRAPGIGHNRPPLAEALDDQLARFRDQQRQLLDIAATAVIIDETSAEKVTNLAAQMAELEREAEELREKWVRPYLDGQKLINGKFNEVIRPLSLARQGDDRRGGLRGMLTRWDDKKRAEAAAERERMLQQAREREEAAAAARRAAEEKAAAGKGSVADELEALHAQDEAEHLAQRAEAIRPEPTRAHLGQVTRTREIRFEVVAIRQTISWMLKQGGLANQVQQAVTTILGKYLRGLGVATIEGGKVNIPGVEVRVEHGAASIRR